MALLEIKDLAIDYRSGNTWVTAVDRLSFSLNYGEFLGIAGESGCGKSTLVHGILGLLPQSARVRRGSIILDGTNVLDLNEETWRPLRWRKLSVVLQSGMNALNPVLRIRDQFADLYYAHKATPGEGGVFTPAELLGMVGVPAERLMSYPHQLSGGQRQRIAIALALALNPRVIIMDEPTTALDVVVQREIFDVVDRIRSDRDFAVILVTHDLSLLLERTSRILVMYAGRKVEEGPTKAMRVAPTHPYTRALLNAFPTIGGNRGIIASIEGSPPSISELPLGCAFHPRCPFRTDKCTRHQPDLREITTIQVACHYPLQEGLL